MTRRRLFGALCSMIFLVNLGRVVFAPLLGEFIDVFQIGEGTVGVIATLAWLGSSLPRVPTGWLLTRVPRHYVIIVTGGLLTAASLFIASATSVAMLAVGALAIGVASGSYFVAANPLVSELYPERVGWAIGIHGMVSQIAAAATAPLVTVILVVFVDWRFVFVAIAIGGAVVTTVLVFVSRSTSLPDAGAADRDVIAAIKTEWRIVGLGVLVVGATGFVWQGLFNFYELYMVTKGLPETTAKNLLTVIFAAGVPAFFVSGRLADTLPRVPYILAIITAFTLCVLALTTTSSLVGIVVLTAVIGYVLHSLFPAVDTFLLGTLPDSTRASAYAWYSGGMMAIQATGSSAVGLLREAGYAFEAIFTWLSLGLLVFAVLLLALQRAGRLPQ